MPYEQQISRAYPTCILFLIDQSGSMEAPFAGEANTQKAEAVADVLNQWLSALVNMCSKDEGLRHYFDVGVIGYADDAVPAFGGKFAGLPLVPITDLGAHPIRYERKFEPFQDDEGNTREIEMEVPVWVDPVANGRTSMCEALKYAIQLLQDWIRRHRDSFPPTIINITDGVSTDGDPTQVAGALKQLRTDDGEVLLFNCHLSSSNAPPVEFPDSPDVLPDEYGRLLFNISSELPPPLVEQAREFRFQLNTGARGLFYNAPGDKLINFLNVGTLTRVK
jgi:hypothetical protein